MVESTDRSYPPSPEELKTEAVCKAAVTQDGSALMYVPEELKTEAVCKAAVTRNGFALWRVPKTVSPRERTLQ
jgi:hypothetical protein